MIQLINDASEKLKELVFETSLRNYYNRVCERFESNNTNRFVTDMQMYIEKFGAMISSVSNGPQISSSSASIKFLCEEVLENSDLVDTFFKMGLDDKNSLTKNDSLDIEECVEAYNSLVKGIRKKYGLEALEYLLIIKSLKEVSPYQHGRVVCAAKAIIPRYNRTGKNTMKPVSNPPKKLR